MRTSSTADNQEETAHQTLYVKRYIQSATDEPFLNRVSQVRTCRGCPSPSSRERHLTCGKGQVPFLYLPPVRSTRVGKYPRQMRAQVVPQLGSYPRASWTRRLATSSWPSRHFA
jgi:hypothetical protein